MPIIRRRVTTQRPVVQANPPVPAPPVEANPTVKPEHRMRPYLVNPHATRSQQTSFSHPEIATIYKFPAPSPSAAPITIGVVSFGGGLVGTLTNGVLTNGDPQRHWTSIGIPPTNHPRVLIKSVNGAPIPTTADPNDDATVENTIDVETLGALCPTSNLTIILYIVNPTDNLSTLFSAALSPTLINGVTYTPSIISCSWGAPESWIGAADLSATNELLKAAAARGILVTAATGDFGSSNGTPYTITDFPSSSPYVLACGGTTLTCPNGVYDSSTVETTWSGSGGGFSTTFAKPSYQSALSGTYRSTPDISLVADPSTGATFTIGGVPNQVIGGTSIVSPAMAAFAAATNINQFLTPLLYVCPSGAFHDVTVGSNGAYSATTGFDRCTGLGSIDGAILAASIAPAAVAAASIAITSARSPLLITVGQTSPLNYSILPTTTTNKTVTFTSSAPAIATVSNTGVIVGLTVGSATITLTTSNGKQTTLLVTVVASSVTGITITGSLPGSIQVGQPFQLTYAVLPSNATNKAVTFTSSAPTVASVNATGLIMGLKAGTAVITIKTIDGKKQTTVPVTVTPVPVVGLNVAPLPASFMTGQTYQIAYQVLPANATNKVITFTNVNPTIASVSTTGLIRALKVGTTDITIKTQDGAKTATMNVIVTGIPVSGLRVSPASGILKRQTSASLVATISPSNATNKAVTWTSNSDCVSVTPTGSIRAVSSGTAVITATTADGDYKATCTIQVKA